MITAAAMSFVPIRPIRSPNAPRVAPPTQRWSIHGSLVNPRSVHLGGRPCAAYKSLSGSTPSEPYKRVSNGHRSTNSQRISTPNPTLNSLRQRGSIVNDLRALERSPHHDTRLDIPLSVEPQRGHHRARKSQTLPMGRRLLSEHSGELRPYSLRRASILASEYPRRNILRS